MKKNLCKIIARKTIENQGCSMNLDGEEPVTGYMVGLKNSRRTFAIDPVYFQDFDEHFVNQFIRANLSTLYNRKVYIGTWMHEEHVVIDCSMNLQNKRAAMAFAQDNGQICIWDVINKKEIYQLKEEVK